MNLATLGLLAALQTGNPNISRERAPERFNSESVAGYLMEYGQKFYAPIRFNPSVPDRLCWTGYSSLAGGSMAHITLCRKRELSYNNSRLNSNYTLSIDIRDSLGILIMDDIGILGSEIQCTTKEGDVTRVERSRDCDKAFQTFTNSFVYIIDTGQVMPVKNENGPDGI